MTKTQELLPARQLACVSDWKIIGIALATAYGAVAAKMLAENPDLGLRARSQS